MCCPLLEKKYVCSFPGDNLGTIVIGLLRGGVPRGGGSLIFPNVP